MSSLEHSISQSSKKMAQTGQSSHSDDSDSSRPSSRQDSWEVVEGLRGILGNAQVPELQEGFLLKKRKWPMKGWHKRYFLLDRGILKYGKTGADLQKGKCRGCIDVGLSVMSIKKKTMCIDLDTEDSIYHLKVKSRDMFDNWVSKLRHHRVFRQNEIAMDPSERHLQCEPTSSMRNAILTKQASIQAMSGLLQSNNDLDRCCQDLTDCESCLLELNLLLKNMEVMQHAYSAPAINTLPGDGSKKEKRGHKKWRSKTSSKDSNSSLQVPSPTRLHVSNPNLSASEPSYPETFLQTPDSPTNAARLQEDFCRLASTIHTTLLSAFRTLSAEKNQIKLVLEQQNTEVDGRSPPKHQRSTESRGSLSDSLSEFFDAREYLLSSSSTDNEVSDDDSFLSDASDSVSVDYYNSETSSERDDSAMVCVMRRTRLPCRSSDSGVSLWNILRNNIGKDLSKVSMPVQLNEPINTLQRLCEEMEYTQLLDTAAHTNDPHLRMAHVAVFAISAYASTFHRAGGKPFNPVLGETYECDRPDKGFKFISEQVSHHPPVSACHCESKNFTVWQDVRWKNKFWGKSMEIVPMGTTHVVLPGFGDHYEWNKVTSCIHNILSGQRWIEHYGEMSIKNTVTSGNSSTCKVTFIKGRGGTSNVNNVEGVVTDADGHAIHSFYGKWNEAIYLGDPSSATCIWRANPMPEDYEQYYGLTQFAVELNELDEKEKPLLPPTDTRFRPDQRLLEVGDVSGAEEQKERIEGLQRERRRVLQENNISHQPKFFKRSEDDLWVSNGTYWDLRKDQGFKQMEFPLLW
ncbi:oxysterol-binding protein-related protein 3a [Alosa sapidissima]|uniref:oxysterol-binding protein-related protein 3a n=1 Tax=Alosa sapidissima TaxID=34773 RepID=UPI001C08D8E9|nr:oxysterol-binding protein-related protein 3a [Alosa sapidissima]